MDFEFSQDQKMIGEQARSFLQKECSIETVRGVLDSDASFDRELWQKIAEMGWLGTIIPEEYDGLGLSYLELAVIAEEIGRALAPVPFASSVYLATELLLIAGNEAQKQQWLPQLAMGSVIGTVALDTQVSATQADDTAVKVNAEGQLTGCKTLVSDAEIADFCILSTSDGSKNSLYLVDLRQEAAKVSAIEGIDLTRGLGNIELNQASAELIGEAGNAQQLLDQLSQRAAVLFAWEQVGGSDAALMQARDYAMERFAFGRPIASFQAIKHKLAQAYVKNTLARSNCYYAIWALDSDAPELESAAPIARVSAIQAYHYSAKENIQTHGGMGFTWEFDCHLHYRRAKSLSLILGGENSWKKRLISTTLDNQ